MLNFYQLEQHIEERMQAAQVPGLALAVVKDRQVIYAKGFGVTSVEDGGLPVTPGTLFRIGSVTKPLTGSAILRLVEAGKLELDRPVKDYLPWLSFSEEGATERITLRMLLSHTTGLVTDAGHFGKRDAEALGAYVREQMPHYQFIAPPGKLWFYSNPGLILAGYIAEVASGQPYTELMQALVFEPLEMQRTTFDPTVAMTYPLAQSHDLNEDGTLTVQHHFADNMAHYPAGFVMSTVLDLANFAIMQMSQGRFHDQQILSPASIASMHTPHASLYTLNDAGYGLTFGTESYKGQRVVGHTGGISSFISRFSMIPAEGGAVILLFNRAAANFDSDRIINTIFDQLLDLPQEAPAPPPVAAEQAFWQQYTGSYLGPYNGLAVIQPEDSELILTHNGERMPLQALRKDLYFAQKPGSEVQISVGFIAEETGATQYVMIDGSPCKRIERAPAFQPDPDTWQAYAGSYEGIDTVQVRLKEGVLSIYPRHLGKEMRAVPIDNARFACEWCSFEFIPDEQGNITQLKLADTWTLTRMQ